MSIQKLIDQTFSYSVEAKHCPGLAKAYLSDIKEYQKVQSLLESNDFRSAILAVDKMDSIPREQILSAITAEFGNRFMSFIFEKSAI